MDKKEIINHSKKIAYKDLKIYAKYSIPLALLQVAIMLTLWVYGHDVGYYLSMIFISIDVLVATLYLVVFDGVPARKLRKENFILRGTKMTKKQGIVFYNALKIKIFYRTLLNLLMISGILVISIMYIIF